MGSAKKVLVIHEYRLANKVACRKFRFTLSLGAKQFYARSIVASIDKLT